MWFAALVLSLSAQDFQKDVAPILESQCISCHGAEKALGALRLDTAAGIGKANKTQLVARVDLPSSKPGAMPPGGPQLPTSQREKLRQWAAAGGAVPAGYAAKAASGVKLDERALVEELHKRIVANSTEFKPYQETIGSTTVTFEMAAIPGGEFTMGMADTGPRHQVKLEPFWMGRREVTWDEYRLFMFAQQAQERPGEDPAVDAVSRPTRPYVEMSFGMGINGYPAISMTQHAANKYAQWLSARTGHFYRLPTEAEWEYACRAGTTTAYSFGDDASQLGEYAWFAQNSNGKYEKVGTKKPNPWGLFDMHGNVMEWTLDEFAPYSAAPAVMPWVRPTKPYPHVVRGGSWNDEADMLRCGARVGSDASWKMQDPQLPKSIWYHTDAQWLGFRLVRPVKVPSADEMYRYWNNGVERE